MDTCYRVKFLILFLLTSAAAASNNEDGEDQIPELNTPDELEAAVAKSNYVAVLWKTKTCSLCVKAIKVLEEIKEEIKKQGVDVAQVQTTK